MIAQIVFKLASKIWLMDTMRLIYTLSYYIPFLYGPLIWFFIRQTAGLKFLLKWDGLHFLPFLLGIEISIFHNQRGPSQYIFPFLVNRQSLMILELMSLAIYHGSAFYLLKKNKSLFSTQLKTQFAARLKWLNQFLLSSLIICCAISVIIYLMYIKYPQLQNLRFGFVLLTIFVYWISYRAWSQPELFQVIIGGASVGMQPFASTFGQKSIVKKYSNSGLDRAYLEKIIACFEIKMQKEKLFLDPDLNIDTLAISIPCSRHHLSQALNEILGKSFNDIINGYRVEETKFLLNDTARRSFKIAYLAFEAGFNSLSTFNEVFKKFTGLTPSQYRLHQQEISLRKQRI